MSQSEFFDSQTTLSPAELVEKLIQFNGPPDQFLPNLLAVQCNIGSATAASICRVTSESSEILAVWPIPQKGQPLPAWLAQVRDTAGKVIETSKSQILPITSSEYYNEKPAGYLALLPIFSQQGIRGVEAFVLEGVPSEQLESRRQYLELTVTLLSLYEMRLTLQQRGNNLQRFHQAVKTIVVFNQQNRYKAAAMALCNQIASAWSADRVSFGLVRGRYVKLQAMSNTEKFTRKMELVQCIESAMEECVDQDVEVLWPEPPDSTTISRAAKELAVHYGPSSLICLPLRYDNKAIGVLCVEREVDKPLTIEEIESLRLTTDLYTPRLLDLSRHDRWFGVRMAESAKEVVGMLVGPKHTWAKISAMAATALIIFLLFAKGTYYVEAPFVIEAVQHQVIASPFEGYMRSVSVRPGDKVIANQTVLAKLDASQWRIELAEAMAERSSYQIQARIKQQENKTAEGRIALAEVDRITARIDLLQWHIDQSNIVSPLSGVVIMGEWNKNLGSPIETGQGLFEVASLESLRAELAVPEDRIADLIVKQTGKLACVSYPGQYLKFEVERIDPVAKVIDQRNVFSVKVKLLETRSWLRPGMEGAAKVDISREHYAWIWTREMVNWIRMKLWL